MRRLWLIVVLFIVGAGPASAQQVLLVLDSNPWGYSAWQSELASNGLSYTQIGGSSLSGTNLNNYDIVITASVQSGTYNSYINSASAQLESFVSGGGVLIFSACTQSSDTPYPIPPFGGSNSYGTSSYGYVQNTGHDLVSGVANPFSGNSASHNYISGQPGGADVIVDQGTYPTLYEYISGNGLLIVSTLTWEWGWQNSQGAGTILQNTIPYAANYNPCNAGDFDGDGYSECDGDCVDNDALIYPGAPEICDGDDNDCDGVLPVDEQDLDADGWAECEGDCDDSNVAVYPGATEVCDGIDNNCNGHIDY